MENPFQEPICLIVGAMFVTFLDVVKNGAPHESIANSNHIEGRAAGQANKKPFKNEEQNATNMKSKNTCIC